MNEDEMKFKTIMTKHGFLKQSKIKFWTISLFSLTILTMAFNNCSEPTVLSEDTGSETEASGKAVCENDLLTVYKTNFHPWMVNHCGDCHSSPMGPSAHGSSDAKISMTAFMQKGVAKLAERALNTHCGNSSNCGPTAYTSSQSDSITMPSEWVTPYQSWKIGELNYEACLAKASGDNIDPAPTNNNLLVLTIAKLAPANIPNQTASNIDDAILTWDLSSEVNTSNGKMSLPVTLSLHIEKTADGLTTFLKPFLKLKAGESSKTLKKLLVRIGNSKESSSLSYDVDYIYFNGSTFSADITSSDTETQPWSNANVPYSGLYVTPNVTYIAVEMQFSP